jgi:hypothetical protein
VWSYVRLFSGGLRYAATTGYYLTALQAAEACRYRSQKTLVLAGLKK